MLKKKGQVFGMSYEFIFGIILIIAILGVAIYAIVYFMGINKCVSQGTFLEDLEDRIRMARSSSTYSGNYAGNIPNSGALRAGIEKVCFGSFDELEDSDDYQRGHKRDGNVFLVAKDEDKKLCLPSKNVTNIYVPDYFCSPVMANGTVIIGMEYNNRENSKVKLFSVS